MHVLTLARRLVDDVRTTAPSSSRAFMMSRPIISALSVVLTMAIPFACGQPASPPRQTSAKDCYRVTPAGPMSQRDSIKISALFRLVRLDTTHVRWNAETDSVSRNFRYMYLIPEVESWGYQLNYWSERPPTDSLWLGAGTGFSAVVLTLAPHGRTLFGYAIVGGDAPVPPQRMGLVRADPAACGALANRRPPKPDTTW